MHLIVLYALIPWICGGIAAVLGISVEITALVWLIISPVANGLAIWIAYLTGSSEYTVTHDVSNMHDK